MSGPPYDGIDPHRAVRLEAMRLRRMEVDDSKISRCRYCGCWRYGQQACSACQAPASYGLDDLQEVVA